MGLTGRGSGRCFAFVCLVWICPALSVAQPADTVARHAHTAADSSVGLSAAAFEQGYRQVNEDFVKRGKEHQGLVLYEVFLDRYPEHYQARMGYAQLLGWSGRYSEAIEIYRSILEERPAEPAARLALAMTLGWKQDYDASRRILGSLLQDYPDNHDARLYLARLLSWQKEYEKSIDAAREVLEQTPDNLYAHEIIGYVFKWLFKYDQASTHFRKITVLDGDSAVIRNAHYQLADILWLRGRTGDAVAMLEDIAESDPDNAQVRAKIAEIEEFLKPRLEVEGHRYQEFTADSVGAGIANNGGSILFRKELNALLHMEAVYQLRNESTDNFATVKQPRLYDVAVQALTAKMATRYHNSGEVGLFFSPHHYWNRDSTFGQLNGPVFFAGAGLSGHWEVGLNTFYFSYERSPLVGRKDSVVSVWGDHGVQLSYVAGLPSEIYLVPLVSIRFFEEGNGRQEVALRASRSFGEGKPTVQVGATFKRYNRVVDRYFSYRSWVIGTGAVEWDFVKFVWGEDRPFRLPAHVGVSYNQLDTGSDNDRFAGIKLKLEPSYAFNEHHSVALVADMYGNTSKYLVYYAGLRYALDF